MTRKPNPETQAKKREAVRLYQQGKLSYGQIAKVLNVSRSSIIYYILDWKKTLETKSLGKYEFEYTVKKFGDVIQFRNFKFYHDNKERNYNFPDGKTIKNFGGNSEKLREHEDNLRKELIRQILKKVLSAELPFKNGTFEECKKEIKDLYRLENICLDLRKINKDYNEKSKAWLERQIKKVFHQRLQDFYERNLTPEEKQEILEILEEKEPEKQKSTEQDVKDFLKNFQIETGEQFLTIPFNTIMHKAKKAGINSHFSLLHTLIKQAKDNMGLFVQPDEEASFEDIPEESKQPKITVSNNQLIRQMQASSSEINLETVRERIIESKELSLLTQALGYTIANNIPRNKLVTLSLINAMPEYFYEDDVKEVNDPNEKIELNEKTFNMYAHVLPSENESVFLYRLKNSSLELRFEILKIITPEQITKENITYFAEIPVIKKLLETVK